MKNLLREPLLHFLLLGAALFSIYALSNHRTEGGDATTSQIVVTAEDFDGLAASFATQQHRAPTPGEMNALVERFIDEEVLCREAIAMGLDQHDAAVRSRLAQKMRSMTEGFLEVPEPTTEELHAWFEQNAENFRVPDRASFRQVCFATDRRGDKAQRDATAALAKLSGQPADAEEAKTLGDSSALAAQFDGATSQTLVEKFGREFVDAIAKAAKNSWQGPVRSGQGWHLVYVISYEVGGIPDFKAILPEIEKAWKSEQRQRALRIVYEGMRAKYTVLLPPSADSGDQPETVSPDTGRQSSGEEQR